MNILAIDTSPSDTRADALVFGVFQDAAAQGAAAEFDRASGGLVGRLIESGDVTGKPNETVTLLAPPGVKASRAVLVGLGKREKFDRRVVSEACGTAAKTLADKPRRRVAFFVADEGWTAADVESGVAAAIVACQGQDLYRAEKKLHPFGELAWAGGAGEAVLERGKILGEAINLTRRLVNEPAQQIYPESFAALAYEMAQHAGIEAEVWDESRLVQERCGALLAVAQGSVRPPRMLILRYRGPGAPGDAPLALVGKGVTFDSGGLSLKPSDGMLAMKCDMAGAATVVGAMQAIARRKLPVNVIGLVGLVENMVSGTSYKLGDVLTARNGRTIEVHNTDAEGRLVLADTLCVAVDQGAGRIIDLATLTGACVVALGNDVAGLMTNNPAWRDRVAAAAEACGEWAWPLPMFDMFAEQIKSPVADIKNVGEGRWGGAITAAKFLEEFVDGKPWVHVDIAGPAFWEKPKPWCDAGASGQFVRTLVEVVENNSANA